MAAVGRQLLQLGSDGFAGVAQVPLVRDSNCVKVILNSVYFARYNLVGNYITDVGAEKLIHGMIGLHHLKRVDIPQQCAQRLRGVGSLSYRVLRTDRPF